MLTARIWLEKLKEYKSAGRKNCLCWGLKENVCTSLKYVCAVQVKYDELLQRCQQATDQLSHKAVQTSTAPFPSGRTRRRLSSLVALSDLTMVLEDGQQPEYKALFTEIFTCIQKTKADLSENRHPVKDSDSQGSPKWSNNSSSWDLFVFDKEKIGKCYLL